METDEACGMEITGGSHCGGDVDMNGTESDANVLQVPKASKKKLALNVSDLDKSASYSVSDLGTLRVPGFEINSAGLRKIDDKEVKSRMEEKSMVEAAPMGELTEQDLVTFGELGRGACGIVLKALHLPTLRIVALKQMSVFERTKRHQMVKEINALHNIFKNKAHNQLILYHGAYYTEGSVSVALEYMNRGSLQDAIKEFGPLPEVLLKRVALHVVTGLIDLHASRVVHRDIKPANVLLNHRGEAKLADFGVVRELEHTKDMATTYVGTAMYMSPERIIQSQEGYGAPADIWSLGTTLIAGATGKPPYMTDSYFGLAKLIRELPPPIPKDGISAAMTSFLQACLAKDPAKRWTAQQLAKHDWLKDADALWQQYKDKSMFALRRNSDTEDAVRVLDIIIAKFYHKERPQPKSLFHQSRLARVASELGFPEADVHKMFESRYHAFLESRKSSQQ